VRKGKTRKEIKLVVSEKKKFKEIGAGYKGKD